MNTKIVWLCARARLGLIIALSLSTLFGTLWSTGLVTPGNYGTWAIEERADIVVPYHYPTIQKAIDAAEEGATIFVRNGEYRENITINKPLKIVGQSRENTSINVNDMVGIWRVVFINSSDVTVCNLTIRDPDAHPRVGIQIGEEWKPQIRNINITRTKIRQCATGIEIKNASDIYIEYNRFEEATPWGIHATGMPYFPPSIEAIYNDMILEKKVPGSIGIEITRSKNSHFFENNMTNIENGIITTEDNGSRYVNNTISGSKIGIRIKKGQNSTIDGNQIDCANSGVIIENLSSNNTVRENKIAGDSRGTGIIISTGGNNTVARNSIKSTQLGLEISSSHSNSIEDNVIYGCSQDACTLTSSCFNNITGNIICSSDSGVSTDNLSDDNRIYHNDFHKNNVQADERGTNQWDNGPKKTPDDEGGGNYWSDYNGTDNDNDGVGDTPHLKDRYPLVVPRSPIPIYYTVFHTSPPYEEEIGCDIGVSAGNITISRFGFNRRAESIVFDATISSTTCWLNITIPKQLLRAAFEVYVDDIVIPCIVCPDAGCCYIYFSSTCFEFSKDSTYSIRIKAEVAIPLTGDVTNNGIVDIYDVVAVIAAWGDDARVRES